MIFLSNQGCCKRCMLSTGCAVHQSRSEQQTVEAGAAGTLVLGTPLTRPWNALGKCGMHTLKTATLALHARRTRVHGLCRGFQIARHP
eukprot:365806-Chlamydomonas_euryale.AAC.22